MRGCEATCYYPPFLLKLGMVVPDRADIRILLWYVFLHMNHW